MYPAHRKQDVSNATLFFFSCTATWKLICQTMDAKDVNELRVWNTLSVHTGNTEPTQQRCQRHSRGKNVYEWVHGCRHNPDMHGWILGHRMCLLTGVGQRLEGRRRIEMQAMKGWGKMKIATHNNSPPERPCCCWWRKVLRAAAAVSLVTESGEIMK